MDNERCEKHGVTRCSTCAFLDAKKNKTKPSMIQPLVIVPPSTKVGVPPPASPPPSITNAAPEDIEMMGATEVHEAQAAYDKELESLLEAKARQEEINTARNAAQDMDYTGTEGSGQPRPGPPAPTASGFDTLPVDDSHASQVVRAASAYADAARDYALKLASYTLAQETALRAATRLNDAAIERDLREKELRELVGGKS
jgi:hypothetical protein